MQYIFRGLTADNKWVYGSLIQRTDGIGKLSLIEVQDKDGEITVWQVKDDSVGMWTTKTDKNGKRIFEGDIVQFVSTESYEYDADYDYEKLGNTPVKSAMAWNDDACGFRALAQSRFKVTINMLEVVGTIYENPELLTPAK
jgi:uncharacterized phage protein (TIGR01671 family)